MMKRFSIGLLLVLAVGVVGFLGIGSKKKVASVQGEAITIEEFQTRLKSFPAQYAAALSQKENKLKILDQMIDEKVLMVAAKKAGIEKSDEFKTQMTSAHNQLLLTLYLRDTVEKKVTVTDQEVRQYYDANPAQFQAQTQRRARHILVKTEVEAKSVLNDLKKGADFATLAKKKSIDPSAQNGGDLGYFAKGQLVPEFEKAVFSMNTGALSSVVKTQFGYHVIRLEDVRTRPAVAFDQVKAQIKDAVLGEKKRKATQDMLVKLKKEYKIKKDESKI